MAKVTTIKRIEDFLKSDLQKNINGNEFFVIKSSDFDNPEISAGENHWRDFSLNIKKNLKAEIVNLKEGHDDESKSDLIVDVLKVNFKGCLFGEIKHSPFESQENLLNFYLGMKERDYDLLENILGKGNFKFRKNFNLEKNILYDLFLNDSKISILPMDYADAIKKLKDLRREDYEKGNFITSSFALFYNYDEHLQKNIWLPRKVFHSHDFIRDTGYYFGEKIIEYAKENNVKRILIYGIQRGGSPLANCISEKIRNDSKLNVNMGVIIASSYINMTKEDFRLDYIVPSVRKVKDYDLILIADDLVDTGTTIENAINSFEESERKKIKTCVIDFKERKYRKEKKFFPDYLGLKIEINSHKEEIWVVYDGELEGLTEKEIDNLYGKNKYYGINNKLNSKRILDFERKMLY
jgi:hypoxanthine-guanine phosphoribosyltransferase